MTFDEWKENNFRYSNHGKKNMRDAFEAGQKNCNCIHTDNTEVISNLENKVKKLEIQIEKMRCCQNCNGFYGGLCLKNKVDVCNDNYEYWEMKE